MIAKVNALQEPYKGVKLQVKGGEELRLFFWADVDGVRAG